MCVPVAPPAKPVAITGWPSAFSVRAMLTPLPPAIVRCSTVRWRRPSRKFGTDSDLSIAALSVTVMIILAPVSTFRCAATAERARCRTTQQASGTIAERPAGRIRRRRAARSRAADARAEPAPSA